MLCRVTQGCKTHHNPDIVCFQERRDCGGAMVRMRQELGVGCRRCNPHSGRRLQRGGTKVFSYTTYAHLDTSLLLSVQDRRGFNRVRQQYTLN
jgi:hypothetical protein